MPWARCAPIYQRLSVGFLFRPFRRSNAPHRRSALTSPICFAEAVKKRRAAQKAADAKQPAELQYGHQVELAIRRSRSVLLFRFRSATEPRKSRFDSQAMIKLTPENRFFSAIGGQDQARSAWRGSEEPAAVLFQVQIAVRVTTDSPAQRPIMVLHRMHPQESRNSNRSVNGACARRIGGHDSLTAFTRIRSKSVKRGSVFRCPGSEFSRALAARLDFEAGRGVLAEDLAGPHIAPQRRNRFVPRLTTRLIIQTQQESSYFQANAINDERVQSVLRATSKTISSFFSVSYFER